MPVIMVTGIGQKVARYLDFKVTGMPARHLYILRIYIRESGKPYVRDIPTLSVGRLRTPTQRVRRIPVPYSRAGKELKILTTEFFLAMNPPTVTHQEHKVAVVNGKPVFYDPPELKAARQKLMAHLGKEVPEEPYTKGLRLVTKWLFPDDGKHGNGTYRITKPDTDNLQKLLKDCMTRVGFWEDDALVASEVTEKFWAQIPGIYIRIEEL